MAKELSSIIAQAAQVRDASQREENTATRVGGVLCNLIENLAEQITAGNLSIVSDNNGTGVSATFYNNEGQTVALTKVVDFKTLVFYCLSLLARMYP